MIFPLPAVQQPRSVANPDARWPFDPAATAFASSLLGAELQVLPGCPAVKHDKGEALPCLCCSWSEAAVAEG